MQKNTLILLTTALLLMLFLSCSSDRNNNATSPLVNDPEISAESQRQLLGVWRLKPDLDTQSTKIEFARDLTAHYDITQDVPDPTPSNESYDGNTQIYQVDLTINNTGLGQDAFDVRLIVYTDNDGTELKNPDNWTALYDMPGGSFINPFKAYATTQPSRRFANGASHTETLNIYLPGGILYQNIVLAIDASIPLNCEEPYLIENVSHQNPGAVPGSNGSMTVEVYDWQEDVNSVRLHCPAITGNSSDEFTDVGDDKWRLNFSNNIGAPHGEYFALISATSVGSGDLVFYHKTNIKISYVSWGHAWGGTTYDSCPGVIADSDGNVYVTGEFSSSVDFGDGINRNAVGNFDIYLCKFNPQGNLLWVKTMGSNDSWWEGGYDVAVDSSDNVYLAGYYMQATDFGDGIILPRHGYSNAFIIKYSPAGNGLWGKSWGQAIASDVEVDSSDNVYLTGHFSDTIDFGDGNPITAPDSNTFLLQLNTDGDLQWVNHLYGSVRVDSYSLATDYMNNVCVVGSCNCEVDFGDGIAHLHNGNTDGFVGKYASNGDFLWGEVYGGSGLSEPMWDVCFDSIGNAYITGVFGGPGDPPVYFGDGNILYPSNYDGYILKLDQEGKFIWVSQIGSSGSDICYAMDMNPFGDLYVTGTFSNGCDFGDGNPITSIGRDAFVGQYDRNGTLHWVKTYGGTGNDGSSDIFINQSNEIVVSGNFGSTDMDFGDGIIRSSQGQTDGYVLVLRDE